MAAPVIQLARQHCASANDLLAGERTPALAVARSASRWATIGPCEAHRLCGSFDK